MTRNEILQETHRSIPTVSDDTDLRANDKLEDAHSTDEVLSSQVEICVSRGMITSQDNLNYVPVELNDPNKHTDGTSTKMHHSTINIIDPGGEPCVRSEVLSKGTDDSNIHQRGKINSSP